MKITRIYHSISELREDNDTLSKKDCNSLIPIKLLILALIVSRR